MKNSILSLENVSKSFSGKVAVKDLSMAVAPNSITGFLGPNGAGKSTSIRMGLGILKPDQGEISLFGSRPSFQVLDRVGFLPEERGLYRKMNVVSVIVHFARLKGMQPAAAKAKALVLLEQFGLAEAANKKVRELSKGMAQKVQIIAAIVHEPEFVILDEPFSGLDPVNQKALEILIRDLAKNGTTILFSTHVMEHAERLCDRIVLLSRGRKIFDGNVDQALNSISNSVVLEIEVGIDPKPVLVNLANSVRLIEEEQSENPRWTVDLKSGVKVQSVLQACVEGGLALRAFEPASRHLHDVFVQMVAKDETNQSEAG